MKAIFPGLCFAFILTTTTAQKIPAPLSGISMEEMTMTTYEKDSSASAIILADYGAAAIVYRQNIGFSLDFERITRIKIFNKEGFAWGNYTIPLYKSGSMDEKLQSLKAVTYNLENGKIVETRVKSEAIFKEDYDANKKIVRVMCPDVREGSVVEVRYKVDSDFLFNIPDWNFQSSIPTAFSEYRVRIPEYFSYDKYTRGNAGIELADQTTVPNSVWITSSERQGKNIVRSSVQSNEISFTEEWYRWVAKDVPAFKPEPFMSSVNNYLSKIHFDLAEVKSFSDAVVTKNEGTWADLNKRFLENKSFGGEITSNRFLQPLVDQLIEGLVLPEEKIAAICNYIKHNFPWNGEAAKYPRFSLEKVFKSKTGNSAEINLLLTCMLEKANISVSPVLLSTRDHGVVNKANPVPGQFNYVICMARVNEKSYLLDATDLLLPLGMLPEQCLNDPGFVVSKDGYQWIAVNSNFKTRIITSGKFVLNPAGKLQGKLKHDSNGYAALSKRKQYLWEGEKEYLKRFVGSHSWEVLSSKIENVEDLQNNFIEEHELITDENMIMAGEMVYLDPFICSSQKDNPFKSTARNYPVDFGSPVMETAFFQLAVPEDYLVEELPESKTIVMPENSAKYTLNVSQTGNLIFITSIFHMNKSLFSQAEYPHLREFYNQMVAKQAEQIVLKRKMTRLK